MLLALVGITGVGKSFFVDEITKYLDFKKVRTIRTRAMRKGEQNGKSGLFMTKKELEKLEREDKIAYKFDTFGGTYAYLKEDIFSKENMIFEMHYIGIYDWKKIRPDIKTIYIFPKDINIAKSKIYERNLEKDKEKERLQELEEHYNRIKTDEDLRSQFDYIFYNNYDYKSEKELLALVQRIEYKNK